MSAIPSDALTPEVAAALHEAGTRASRDFRTFAITSGAFAASYAAVELGAPVALRGGDTVRHSLRGALR